MKELITLYDPTYTTKLFTTEDRQAAEQYLRNSQMGWLPIIVNYGNNWQCRWAGRICMQSDGSVEIAREAAFCAYLLHWPTFEEYAS